MQNVIAVEPGTSSDAILLMAHHDAQSPGPSANDNGSGVGMLIELARTLVGTTAGKTVILASTDGSLAGSAGARRLAAHLPSGYRIGAVIALDAVGRDGPLWIRMDSDTVRQPAAGLVHGIRTALLSHGLADVRVPSLGRQAAGLLAPLGIGEQAPFIGRGIAAVTLDGSTPNTSPGLDQLYALSAARMGRVGNSVQALVLAYEAGPAFESPASSYLLSSDRVIRGWTLQLLLLALVVPAVLPLLDLVARGTRRGIPLAAALRDLGRRLAAPLAALAVLRVAGIIGAVPDLHAPPYPGDNAGVSLWVPGLALAASMVAWRLARRPAAQADARDPAAAGVAGYLAALFGALRRCRAGAAREPVRPRARAPGAAPLARAALARAPRADRTAQHRRARLDRAGPARRGARGPRLARRLCAALGGAAAVGRGTSPRRDPVTRDAVRRDLAARRDRQRALRQRQHVDELAHRRVRAARRQQREPVGKRRAAELM